MVLNCNLDQVFSSLLLRCTKDEHTNSSNEDKAKKKIGRTLNQLSRGRKVSPDSPEVFTPNVNNSEASDSLSGRL